MSGPILQRQPVTLPLLLALLVTLLVACSSDPEPTPTTAAETAASPVPTPTPEEIMASAGEAMNDLRSARFEITRNGAPAYLDDAQALNFSAAVGEYEAPSSVSASLTVLSSGAAIEIQTIAIGDDQWITNPLNQRWEQLPPGWGFNPAILFDEEQGWLPLLQRDISDVSLLEVSQFGDISRYRVSATASGERVKAITGGVAGDESVTMEAFVDTQTFYITQLSFSTLTDEGEESDWLLKFFDFNADIAIERPPGT